MSNVLFDAPGPRARVRHRVYSGFALIALIGLALFVVRRFSDNGQLEYELWEPFVTPEYIRFIGEQALNTLKMATSAILAAVVFGVIFGIGKLSDHTWIRWPCWAVVEFFRAIPVLLLMVFVFYTYGIGDDGFGSYWAVVIALVLYNGSVLAEVFRAGILAVPAGQSEAAYAIGMRKTQVTIIILLPQAVKIMLPAIISQMVVALKDTSLGFYIGSVGLTDAYKLISGEFFNHVQAAIVITAIYVVINLIVTWIATIVQKRLVGTGKELQVAAVGTYASGAGAGGGN